MTPTIIFGTGSMARVLYSFMRKQHNVIGFCADDEFVTGKTFMGLPLFKFSQLPMYKFRIAMAMGYHDMNERRAKRFADIKALRIPVTGFVCKKLLHHDNVILNSTAIIYDNVTIHPNSAVHENVFISSNVSIGHDCDIGAHAWINSGVSLAGGVTVGPRCVLGINSSVAQGVTLGEGTFVGANALVTRDTEAGAVIVAQAGEVIAMDSKRFTQLTGQP